MNNQTSPRPILSKKELLPILSVFALASLLWLCVSLFSPKAAEALISQDGQPLAHVSLNEHRRMALDGKLTLVFDGQGVWAENAACKDQVCVRTGRITKSGEALICLPAGISVRLVGGEGYDSITY